MTNTGANCLRAIISTALSVALLSSRIPAQAVAPIRDLAAPTAASTRAFGLILNVRPLADGRVLVNDGGSRQLVILDSTLSIAGVLLDSVAGGTASYGPRASPLIPYLGDSVLFVDGQSLSLLLITPQGKPDRVIAAPKPAIVRELAGSSSGVDRNGSLIYRGTVFADEKSLGPGQATVLSTPDSVAIIRANFETRIVDTIARVKVSSGGRTESLRAADGSVQTKRIVNPISTMDEWAVLTDGSVALVRGYDYHIDWIRADGSRVSTPKLPFDWKQLTDTDKNAVIDSARVVWEKAIATAAARPRPDANGRKLPPEVTTLSFVPLSEMGAYQPAIRSGAVKADLDNNIWILPATSAQSKNGELVYDVVNSSGTLTHRVRVPLGHSIAGFGHKGVVFLMNKEADKWVLKRSRVM